MPNTMKVQMQYAEIETSPSLAIGRIMEGKVTARQLKQIENLIALKISTERKTWRQVLKLTKRIFTENGLCGCGVHTWEFKHDSPCWCSTPSFNDLRQAIVKYSEAAQRMKK